MKRGCVFPHRYILISPQSLLCLRDPPVSICSVGELDRHGSPLFLEVSAQKRLGEVKLQTGKPAGSRCGKSLCTANSGDKHPTIVVLKLTAVCISLWTCQQWSMLYLDQLEGKSQTLIQTAEQGLELTLVTTFTRDSYRKKRVYAHGLHPLTLRVSR